MPDSRSSHVLVDICWRGDEATVAVHGEIDLLTAPVLSARLDEVIDVIRPRRLILDLAGVAFLDCAGARAIAGARAALPECCQVVICSLRPSPRRVLEITGLWHGCLVDGAAQPGLRNASSCGPFSRASMVCDDRQRAATQCGDVRRLW